MSTVSGEDQCSPFVRHDGTDVNTLQPPQRINIRWGEYDVSKDGRDGRQSDGLCRFRNNFDCCHEVPLESQVKGFEGQMLPKPLQENVTANIDTERYSKKENKGVSKSKFAVFPQQDSERKDFAGDFVLGDTTRDAIQNFHNKLHRGSPRYGGFNTDVVQSQSDTLEHREKRILDDTHSSTVPLKRVRFADDICQPLDMRPVPRLELDFLSNPSNWPSFENESTEHSNIHLDPINELTEQTSPEEEVDENQNFCDLLLPNIYQYRLPSTFHYDQFYTGHLNLIPIYRTNDSGPFNPFMMLPHGSNQIPSLLAEKEAVERGLREKNLEISRFSRTFIRPVSPGVDDWVNSSEQLKLKLAQKALTQKMYHQNHPDEVPDLRDFTTYSKRVFFHGYNSSAFRG